MNICTNTLPNAINNASIGSTKLVLNALNNDVKNLAIFPVTNSSISLKNLPNLLSISRATVLPTSPIWLPTLLNSRGITSNFLPALSTPLTAFLTSPTNGSRCLVYEV